jgi:hypothetical protein
LKIIRNFSTVSEIISQTQRERVCDAHHRQQEERRRKNPRTAEPACRRGVDVPFAPKNVSDFSDFPVDFLFWPSLRGLEVRKMPLHGIILYKALFCSVGEN